MSSTDLCTSKSVLRYMNMNKALKGIRQRPIRKQMTCTCVRTPGEGDGGGESGAFGDGLCGDLAPSRAGALELFIYLKGYAAAL